MIANREVPKVSRHDKRRYIDVPQLKRQAATIFQVMTELHGSTSNLRARRQLEGVWNMLHIILDDLKIGRECILEISD